MKIKYFILILFSFFSYLSNAQFVNTGWVYGGEGNQSALKSYIDNSGNRYTIFNYNNEFYIDSLGTPILLKIPPRKPYYNSGYAKTIAKFNQDGVYQYH